jgi:N-methylhydantoinase A/oxoprolinase/acetone carboxylase beta subunit
VITFDMGGTSADIGIVTEDGIAEASARDTWIGGYPLLVPMLDVHTIGAGGGSIAYVDEGGAFRVGPRSAGADPGPACYGNGGEEPTISDAHVVLGRLDPERFLGGRMTLDRDAAVEVVGRLAEQLGLPLAETAEGILTIANSNMARAIRSRTIEKGNDPRDFALVAFGGAGPLHAAEVAESLGIPEVLVPPYPGITSAAGLLTSDLKYDQMRTVFQLQGSVDADRINRELDGLESELRALLDRDGVAEADVRVIRALDCRYIGQGYELRVMLDDGPFAEAALEEFHRLHEREYGSAYGDPIEIVNARVSAIGRRPTLHRLPVESGTFDDALVGESEGLFRVEGQLRSLPTRFYDRALLPLDEPFDGPSVVFHLDTTTVVLPGWQARADRFGNLLLVQAGAP